MVALIHEFLHFFNLFDVLFNLGRKVGEYLVEERLDASEDDVEVIGLDVVVDVLGEVSVGGLEGRVHFILYKIEITARSQKEH